MKEEQWINIAYNLKRAKRAFISIISVNIIIIIVKTYLFLITGALILMAFLADSILDILNDVISIFAVHRASKPPDMDHPYGHGKYEALARIMISIALFFTAFEIVSESLNRILTGSSKLVISQLVLYLIGILALVYVVISVSELIAAKRTEVNILKASAWHYITDPITSIFVLVSLWLVSIGYWLFDIIGASIICVLIGFSALGIFKEASTILLDQAVIDSKRIRDAILAKFYPKVVDCHDIRTRTDGFGIYLECHILVKDDLTVKEAHDIAHKVEDFIRKRFREKLFHGITIHIEPEVSHDRAHQ